MMTHNGTKGCVPVYKVSVDRRWQIVSLRHLLKISCESVSSEVAQRDRNHWTIPKLLAAKTKLDTGLGGVWGLALMYNMTWTWRSKLHFL
jgi:hypothetical protein